MPRVNSNSTPSDGIMAVTLTFSVMEALAKSRSGLGVTELSNLVGATKSRVHRHLVTLLQAGYAAQDPQTEKYCVGSAMVALAGAVVSGLDPVAIARPALTQLRDEFGHTTLLARWEGEHIRVLDVVLGTSDFAIVQRPGNVLGAEMLHCSALGKIVLAFGPPELLQKVLSRRLRKPTPNTITERRALIAEMQRVRKRGWASVPDEGMLGFNAIAVPIIDAHQRLAAMVGVIGPTRLLPAVTPANLVDRLLRVESQISGALGRAGTLSPVALSAASRRNTEGQKRRKDPGYSDKKDRMPSFSKS